LVGTPSHSGFLQKYGKNLRVTFPTRISFSGTYDRLPGMRCLGHTWWMADGLGLRFGVVGGLVCRSGQIKVDQGEKFLPRMDTDRHGWGGTVGWVRTVLADPLRRLGGGGLWFSIRACLGGTYLEESGAEATALQTLREGWERWWVGGSLADDSNHESTGLSHDFPTGIFRGRAVFAEKLAGLGGGVSGQIRLNPAIKNLKRVRPDARKGQ
jgi:hypothetical protein